MNRVEITKIIDKCNDCPHLYELSNDMLDCFEQIDFACQHPNLNGYEFIKEDVHPFEAVRIPDFCPLIKQ